MAYNGTSDKGALYYNAFNVGDQKRNTYVNDPRITSVDFTNSGDAAEYSNGMTAAGFYAPVADVATQGYNNFVTGARVTQNLLVYTAADTGDEKEAYDGVHKALDYSTATAERYIKGHHIVATGGDPAFATRYLHLVERSIDGKNSQRYECVNNDFFAPLAFNVTDKAWYTRRPVAYATYSNDAWEGICLPFTVKKTEASTNGEITHFYGTPGAVSVAENMNTLHHEYWLRGMTAVAAGTGTAAGKMVATFSRPGTVGGDVFVNAAQTAAAYDHSYGRNTFIMDTYGDRNYNQEDNGWYNTAHTFTGYLPLTASVPYIISFPGEPYYEFDLSNRFYSTVVGGAAAAQNITFSNEHDVLIPVTPSAMQTAVGGYYHTGTFMAKETTGTINAAGTEFVAETGEALPFRTYITSMALAHRNSMEPQLAKPFSIGVMGAPEVIGDSEEDGDDGISGPALRIYPQGRKVVVQSTYATTLTMYNANGVLYRVLDVRPGTNTFSGFPEGIFVVGTQKLHLK